MARRIKGKPRISWNSGLKTGLALIFLIPVFLSFSVPGSAEIFYPWKNTFIGALDPTAWPGLMIAMEKDAIFAFLLRVEKENETADETDFLYVVAEVGPHSADGQYARVSFDLGLPLKMGNDTPVFLKPPPRKQVMTMEWSRRDENTVIGRIICPAKIKVNIVHYFPWEAQGDYVTESDHMIYGVGGPGNSKHYYFWIDKTGEESRTKAGELILSYDTGKGLGLYFAATAGEDRELAGNRLYRYKNAVTISDIISEEAELYEQKRVRIKGLYQGAARAIANNINWMVTYQPDYHRLYTPAGRGWIFPRPDGGREHWTIFNWDSFLNALELSVESTKLSFDAVRAVLETQYPNGNIPNWRGRFGGTTDRSQPPVGAWVVLRLFQKTGDIDFLKYAYAFLKKWHDFWTSSKPEGSIRRDGNADGLLEWGSDTELVPEKVPSWEENAPGRQRAAWESGQDDLPNWDDVPFDENSGTLTLNCVDLNSLYALDSLCLSEIASLLDYSPDYEIYRAQYEKTKSLVNRLLWNEREEFYLDRFWDGTFSARKAASNFLPMLAGIPDESRARKMLKHLLDPKKFWGEYVIPTISRDDASFKPDNQQYWRGTIWPPINYLVYHGLRAYSFDAPAAEFARKSMDMFFRTWKNFQICPENFDSLTGEAGGQRFQSWGPLFALMAVEEYIDFTPAEGFRFGMLKPEKSGRLSRIQIQGRKYDIEVSRSKTLLFEEGKKIIEANNGAVFRRFLYSEQEISFVIKTLDPTEIKIWMLRKGRYQLLVDGKERDVFNGNSARFEVEAGDHNVLIQLLRDSGKK